MAEPFLKELPVYNVENFSKFEADSHKRGISKKPPVYVPTADECPSMEIVTEKTNILLRYLHQTWERKCPRRKRDLCESRGGNGGTSEDNDNPSPGHSSNNNSTSNNNNSGAGSSAGSSSTAQPRTKRPRQDNGNSGASNSNDST